MRRVILALICAVSAAAADPAVPAPRVLPKVAFTLSDFVAQTPRNADGAFRMEIPELVNLSLSAEAREILESKSIEFVGQLTRADGRWRVVRSLMSCCAVHAKQYGVAVQLTAERPPIAEMSWVKINGTISFRDEREMKIPVIAVGKIVAIDAPKNPLLR